MRWPRPRLAVIGYVILALGLGFALLGVQTSQAQSCHDRKHQYDALHNVIDKSYAPSAPSAAVLDAFPQLKPFYTPGNPQYEAQQQAARDRKQGVLALLGDRPSC